MNQLPLSKDHTVILSSHILAEVQEICDDILIISKGKLIAEGSPEELEELTHGKEAVELTIQADEASVKQVLSGFSGIDDISWLDVNENSCHIQINTSKDTQELCADLSLAFAQKKMPVTQMFVNKATLEDIFLELTGDELVSESSGKIPETASKKGLKKTSNKLSKKLFKRKNGGEK